MRDNLELGGGLIMAEAVMLKLGQAIGRQHAHDVVYDAAQTAAVEKKSFAGLVAGGALAATGLILIALLLPWMWQIAVYALFGFGFYLLHSCIQVHVTELSQTARGAAASLHSSFFYLGQAVGPVVYGYGFAHGGPEPSIFVGAAVVMTVGLVCSRLLRHRAAY